GQPGDDGDDPVGDRDRPGGLRGGAVGPDGRAGAGPAAAPGRLLLGGAPVPDQLRPELQGGPGGHHPPDAAGAGAGHGRSDTGAEPARPAGGGATDQRGVARPRSAGGGGPPRGRRGGGGDNTALRPGGAGGGGAGVRHRGGAVQRAGHLGRPAPPP